MLHRLLLIVALLTVSYTVTVAQRTFSSQKEARAAIDTGYLATKSGWNIRVGDTLTLGKGTLIGGGYTYIYESLAALTANGQKQYLKMATPGQFCIIKKFGVSGTKSTGVFIFAVVGMGLAVNYWIEIDNALAAGEIVVPAKYRTATASTTTGTLSVADELTKLKKLKDDGILTEDEFQAQKKKLLNLN